MNRRDFLKTIAGGAAAILIPLPVPKIAVAPLMTGKIGKFEGFKFITAISNVERTVFWRPDWMVWQVMHMAEINGVEHDWAVLEYEKPNDERLKVLDDVAWKSFVRASREGES